jgi:hypothetical protein
MTIPLFRSGSSSNDADSAAATPDQAHWARYANATLGLWLFLSAFGWSHTPSSRVNTCLVGLFVGVSAITATGWVVARRLTVAIAFWLMLSTAVAYVDRPATFWNNMIVAVLVLVLSTIPHEPHRSKPLGGR